MQTPFESLRGWCVDDPLGVGNPIGQLPLHTGKTEVRERSKGGRQIRACARVCQFGICRQPRYPRPLFGTGGFASPSFDGFAKTSARSLRRQTESTHLYLLRYWRCHCACLTKQQSFDEREQTGERAAIVLQNFVRARDHLIAACSIGK